MKDLFVMFLLLMASASVRAEVTIDNPWVRATVPQQKFTGAFMQITSSTPARLVAAQSPVAEHLEIHEMKMESGVMKMREVPGLSILPGKVVQLSPGGYHVMFMGLKHQVKDGDMVPIKLIFERPDRKNEVVEITAIARPLNAGSEKSE